MLHTLVYSCTYPHVIPYTKYMLICYLELKVSFLLKKCVCIYLRDKVTRKVSDFSNVPCSVVFRSV